MLCLSYDSPRHYDSYDAEKERLERDIANLEAALCTALTYIESTSLLECYMADTDWKEVGIGAVQVLIWWGDRKEKDRIRREKEQATKLAAAQVKRDATALRVLTLQSKSWAELTKAEIKFLTTHAKK